MASTSTFISPSGTQCHVLTKMKTMPLPALFVQARTQHLTLAELDILEMAVNSMLNDADRNPFQHKLAEFLYFRWGNKLVQYKQYNRMTRLHMEHECLARALLPHEEMSKTSDFGLRVLLRGDWEWVQQPQNPLVFPGGSMFPSESEL
ncbi:hypothetical protein K458DRAFT_408933 [Lentithecium fluviatile CBS 122367]|uniref:Uncharacterized protein n=1 Tax=Lentithecium fluviatile CBS 122367 TaxID=1168545 RepID=A0A6G1IKG9_9PLEO|nr:hypothetical protein K458DRAFT_408933 [Lentithecium fluviatile CBS 122367]